MLVYKILAFNIHGKIWLIHTKTTNLKYQLHESPDESYSVTDIQDCFERIFKKHETLNDYPPVKKNINQIESRTTFKIKTGYYLELTSQAVKLLGSTKNKITKGKSSF